MLFEEGLAAFLATRTALVSLVGDRIYPVAMPASADPTWPSLTYQRVGDTHSEHMSGSSGVAIVRVQFTAWGPELLDVLQVLEELRLSLHGYRGLMGGVIVQGAWRPERRSMGWQDAARIYAEAFDISIAYVEPRP